MRFHVTVKAFGRVSSHTYEADSEAEAVEKAKLAAGLTITSKPVQAQS